MDVHVVAEVYCVIVSISTSTPTQEQRNESTMYVCALILAEMMEMILYSKRRNLDLTAVSNS